MAQINPSDDSTIIGEGVIVVTTIELTFSGPTTPPKEGKVWGSRKCTSVEYEERTISRVFGPVDALVDGAKLALSRLAEATGSGKTATPDVWIATIA